MSRLEKVRAEWRHFEREDQPAYLRWSAETFGAVLTELRTNQALLLEKRELIEQVEFELYASGSQNYRAAYARVIKRRSQPWDERDDEHPPQDGAVPGSTAEYFESLHESEQKFIFEEFLRTVLGLNPKRLSKKEYQRMFTEFRDELADQEGKSPPRSGTGFSADADETGAPRRGHQRAHQSGRPDPSDPPPPPPPRIRIRVG